MTNHTTDRRTTRRTEPTNNMAHILRALTGIAADADAIAAGTIPAALGYDVARRALALQTELTNFRARDLINMRQA